MNRAARWVTFIAAAPVLGAAVLVHAQDTAKKTPTSLAQSWMGSTLSFKEVNCVTNTVLLNTTETADAYAIRFKGPNLATGETITVCLNATCNAVTAGWTIRAGTQAVDTELKLERAGRAAAFWCFAAANGIAEVLVEKSTY